MERERIKLVRRGKDRRKVIFPGETRNCKDRSTLMTLTNAKAPVSEHNLNLPAHLSRALSRTQEGSSGVSPSWNPSQHHGTGGSWALHGHQLLSSAPATAEGIWIQTWIQPVPCPEGCCTHDAGVRSIRLAASWAARAGPAPSQGPQPHQGAQGGDRNGAAWKRLISQMCLSVCKRNFHSFTALQIF